MKEPIGTLRWPKYGDGDGDEFVAGDTEVLGTGGQATVVAAWQRGLRRRVAVKLSLDGHGAQERLDALMAQEASALAALDHPDIVALHAVAMTDDGRPALAMERVDGVPWTELLSDPAHPMWVSHGEVELPVDAPQDARLEAHLRILMRVCSAVQHVNDVGIIHGDLKPANVVVGPLGRATLLDFGISRTASEDSAPNVERGVEGTAAFMAPEVANGAAPNKVASDVFTLGAILHLVLTGKGPYQRRSPFSTLVACASGDRQPAYSAATPVALADVCERAISFEASDRFPSAGAFRLAIDTFLRRRTASTLLEDAVSRIEQWRASLASATLSGDSGLRETAPANPLSTDALEDGWQRYQDCHMRLEAVRSLWSDNSKVRAWSRIATTTMATLALEHKNLDLADQLIVELDEPSELRDRYLVLAEEQANELAALARIRSLVDDSDGSKGWRARRLMISAIAVAVGATLFINGEILRLGWATFGLKDVQWSGMIWLVLSIVGVWRSWTTIAPNQAARRQVQALLVLLVMGAVNWPLCHQLGLDVSQALHIMLFWIGLCGFMASYTLDEPRFATASTAVVATLTVALLVPGWSFHFAGLALWLAAIFIMRKTPLRGERARSAASEGAAH